MNTPSDDFSGGIEILTVVTAETVESKRIAGTITEMAANWLAPHYLLALRGQMAERTDGPDRFKLLGKAARDIVAIQRGGVSSARLQLDRKKLEFKRQKRKDFAAANLAEQKQRDPNEPMTEAELKACVDKVNEIFRLKSAPDEERKEP